VKKIYFALFSISLLSFIFSAKHLYSNDVNTSPGKLHLKENANLNDLENHIDTNVKNVKWEELYFKANQYYKEGKFENALNTYNEVLENGRTGGDLFYNMGNTCYRLNLIGHAILYYERARNFLPRDPDLDYNLRYVKKLKKDAAEDPSDIFSGIFFWTRSLTLAETFLLFSIVNIFLWASFILRIYLKKEWTYYLPIILLVAWFVTGLSFGLKYYSTNNDNRAVVLTETADVLSGPDPGDTLLFQLHSGTVVTQEREEDDWKLIRLPDNKRGWIQSNAVEKIQRM
jgi:tetratricopeptide (TPR) repeat protein